MVCVPHNTLYFPLCQVYGHLKGDFFDAAHTKKIESCQPDSGCSLMGRFARRDSMCVT